jgi:glycine/D-amino acid oxidase-like deaminating enzyme
MHNQSDRRSLWEATAAVAEHPALAFNVRVNVAVIGGGVAGATSAYLLKRLGRTVALVDGYRCGLGQTGRTAGHVMAAPTLDVSSLVDRLGADRTRALWDAGGAAIARIRSIVRDERINCQFAWVPAYLRLGATDTSTNGREDLVRQAALAESLGIDAAVVTHVPGLGRPALRFGGQARLHPLNYLRVLVDQVPGAGSYVFEDTHIDTIEGTGPFIVRSGEYRITADVVIAATHHRLLEAAPWQVPELRVARAYVVAGTAPGHHIDDGLYWDQEDLPYGCLRVDRQDDQTLALIGGRDASVQEVSDARAIFRMLSERLMDRVPGAIPEYQWSAHTVETPDGLPCLGAVGPGQIVAMACGDNSLTFGTLGGMIAADLVLGRANPWAHLFSPGRFGTAAVSGRLDMPATAGRRPRHDSASFEALTHQDVAFAHTDGALPLGCPD